jgi:hypothetical protein
MNVKYYPESLHVHLFDACRDLRLEEAVDRVLHIEAGLHDAHHILLLWAQLLRRPK